MTSFEIEAVLQALAAGLLAGSTYGLMCAALGLIFGIMRLINFAQGDFLMLGMYFGFYMVTLLGLGTLLGPLPAVTLAALAAIPVFFVFGAIAHKLLLSRIEGDGRELSELEMHQAQLMMTFGISLVLTNGALMLFGSTPVTINTPLSFQAIILKFPYSDITLFLNQASVAAAVVAIITTGLLYVVLHRTDLGRRLRAAADNPLAATYMGINIARSHRITFGLGIGLTAVAGVMVATYYPFQPYVGLDFVIIMYAGVVLGGMGSVLGSFWGGLIIGLVQQLSNLVLPLQLQSATVFVVFLAILLLMPQGLFGRSAERA
jgi:branched-chain amino acid transport system permease protein